MPRVCLVRAMLVGLAGSLHLLLASAAGSAQVRDGVAGQILDRATRDPVIGALVEVQTFDGSPIGPLGVRTTTGQDGRFLVGGVEEGAYLVRVEHLSYGTHLHPLRLEGEGTASIEIVLSAEAIELEPILVDAEASRDPRWETICVGRLPASRCVLPLGETWADTSASSSAEPGAPTEIAGHPE